jgi:cell division protein FtsB
MAFAIASIGLLLSAVAGERGLRRVFRLHADLRETSQQNFYLLQSIHALRHRVQAIRSDDAYLERVARRRLSLVRNGEVLYRLATPAAVDGADASRAPTQVPGTPQER